MVVNIIRAFPGTTSSDLGTLGLLPRGGRPRRRHVPAPTAPPRLLVREVTGRRVSVQVSDRDATTRRKPRDVSGVNVFAFIGDEPPARITRWQFVKGMTRTRTVIILDPQAPPGTKVWLTAQWTNWREEPGPLCTPVFTHLNHEGAAVPGSAEARPDVSFRCLVDQQPASLTLAA
jgi:hypothetical protein